MERTLYVLDNCRCSHKAVNFLAEFGLDAEIKRVRGPVEKWEVNEHVTQTNVPVLVEQEDGEKSVYNGVNEIAKHLEAEHGPDKSLAGELKWWWIMFTRPKRQACSVCKADSVDCCTRSPLEV